jgi:ATP-dependent protease ClpP protease subunit
MQSDFLALSEASRLVMEGTPAGRRRAVALVRSTNLGTWWQVRSYNGETTRISVFGTISDDTLRQQLPGIAGGIELQLDDVPGGDAYAAMELARVLSERRAVGIVTGDCASAANIMLAGCERRIATTDATFMLHAIRCATCSTAPELRCEADALDAKVGAISDYFAARLGISRARAEAYWTGPDVILNATEAKAIGLIHEIIPTITRKESHQSPHFLDDESLAFEMAVALQKLNVRDKSALRSRIQPWLAYDEP